VILHCVGHHLVDEAIGFPGGEVLGDPATRDEIS
jgi:hypothetical protein